MRTSLLVLTLAAIVLGDIVFPKEFMFGSATASYQIEGAAKQDGRGASIWDVFAHTPGKTHDGQTGDVACDHYNRFAEDVEIMRKMGLKYYRMSLSWSRLLPNGTLSSINQKGIDHYNREFDLLIKNGITPFVTLYHWDLPQRLHEQFGGWLNTTLITKAFGDYADLAFKSFGDRVKHWITFNEALTFSVLGYGAGVHAPGRCTGCKPEGGNSSTEPYIVSHSQILSHATAVNIYRTKYASQKGSIGMTMSCDWSEPFSDKPDDLEAAERAMLFEFGWFADPQLYFDYPQTMKDRVGKRLPAFTEEEKLLLRASKPDFLGLNHYSSSWVGAPREKKVPSEPSYYSDMDVWGTREKDGKMIGPVADSDWLYVVPWGSRHVLNWVAKRYSGIDLYIFENGVDVPGEDAMPLEQALNDTFRLNYISDYLTEMSKAVMIDKVPLRGYFCWSLMDNYECIKFRKFTDNIQGQMDTRNVLESTTLTLRMV